MIDFKNKKILITGATGGIGYSLVEKFNKAIDAIRSNGTYDTIRKKYFDFDIYGK